MNNQAPELSPEARRLINEARGADDPTPDDQARVKARWLASVAAVAGVSSLTEAARAAGGIGWGFKAAGAALVIAAGAIGLNFALDGGNAEKASETAARPGWISSSPERFEKTPRSRAEPEKLAHGPGSRAPTDDPAAVAAPSAQAMPVPADPALPTQPQAAAGSAPSEAAPTDAVAAAGEAEPQVSRRGSSEPLVSQPVVLPTAARAKPAPRAVVARGSMPKTAENTAPKAAENAAPKAVDNSVPKESASAAPIETGSAAAGPSGQLSEELALLSDVRGSIQAGAASRALELLNRYESRFGQPILGMEADALRVDALCKAGQRDAARESARAFQKEWPGSPLERRVSAACP